MAAKVLNVGHRNTLKAFAWRLVKQTQDTSQVDAAYDLAASLVAAVLEGKYPKKDMDVLKKYNLGRQDSCVFLSPGYGQVIRFNFRDQDTRVPHQPDRYCNGRTPHLLNDEQAQIVKTYEALKDQWERDVTARSRDFDALISVARTFEGLVEVWPAANQLREHICGKSSSVAAISAETISRIKLDPAANAQGQ